MCDIIEKKENAVITEAPENIEITEASDNADAPDVAENPEKPAEREVAISVRNICKSHRRYKNNHQRMQHLLYGRDVGELVSKLDDISFDIYKGETVGILGGFGSGKTTLLQILAGLIPTDSGTYEINGDVTTIFDHRLCFDGSLSVRTNIYIKCSVLGYTFEESKQIAEELLEFTGLTEMADQNLRSMPKGTATKIGFLISTLKKPDILLYDESLTLGGAGNDERYLEKLHELLAGEGVTALVPMTNGILGKRFCDRGIVLNECKIVYDGPYEKALKYYRKKIRNTNKIKTKTVTPEIEETEMDDAMEEGSDFGF
jgi:teichoic acid transport system ATP-binding protein